MNEADLIRMANQIARNFEHLPPAEARAAVADHLKRFWAKSMREQLAAIQAREKLHALLS